MKAAMLMALLAADGRQPVDRRATSGWYVGINPLAAFAPFVREYDIVFQIVTGTEVGFALSGGFQLSPRHTFGARLSAGMPNSLQWLTQASLAWKIFPFDFDRLPRGGFFVGPNLRFGHIVSIPARVAWLNVVPSIDVGWCQTFGRVYVNARVTQSLVAITAASDPRILPAVGWALTPDPAVTPVLPVVSLDVGWQF